MRPVRLDAAAWQRIFGGLGLAMILAGAFLPRLDTTAVVLIVGFFMGGNAMIKTTANLSTRKRN